MTSAEQPSNDYAGPGAVFYSISGVSSGANFPANKGTETGEIEAEKLLE